MSYEIDAEMFLVNIFRVIEKDEISFPQLRSLRKMIEGSINKDLYINITKESINDAANTNSFYITTHKTIKISSCIKEKLEDDKFIEENYNWVLPHDIKEQYEDVLKRISSEEV